MDVLKLWQIKPKMDCMTGITGFFLKKKKKNSGYNGHIFTDGKLLEKEQIHIVSESFSTMPSSTVFFIQRQGKERKKQKQHSKP